MRRTKNSFGLSHNALWLVHEIHEILLRDGQIGYHGDGCDRGVNPYDCHDDCHGGYHDDYHDENDCGVWNDDHDLWNGRNANDYDFDGNCYGDDYVCFYYYDVCRHLAY